MPTATSTTFSSSEINKLLKLLIPLGLTGFLETSVGFFSTLFLAHLGTKELAAGAIAQWVFFTLVVVLWGTLSSISFLVSQKFGARDEKAIAQTLFDGLVLGLLLTIPSTFLLMKIAPILTFFSQDKTTVVFANTYMQGMVWALLPDFISVVLLQFLIGLGHTKTNLVFSLAWVPLNVFCNYSFVFGKFGFPDLGIAGIGWGSALSYWLSLVGITFYLIIHSHYRHYLKMLINLRRTRYLLELLQVGLPIGIMFCIEVAFFLTLSLLIGRISITELAANQITLQFMGQMSVLTFAVAQAVTVRMGHALGAGHVEEARRAAYIGMSIAVGFMLLVAICNWFIPEKLIGLDLTIGLAKNAEIIAFATKFLALCAIFQIFEAVRFSMFGALRSLKDTRFTLFNSVVSFWCVALPLGYVFSHVFNNGGIGMWWGIVVGGLVGMACLLGRFHVKMRAKMRYVISARA